MDDAVRDAWIKRVLGMDLRAPRPQPVDLAQRVQSAARALRVLRDVAAPEFSDLTNRLVQIRQAAALGPVGATESLAALERDIARAASAARAREGGSPKGRGVAYVQMLLRWRAAQETLNANLAALGTKLLARREIQEDPRLDSIKQGVAALPQLVPKFGGELEDALDAGMSATDGAERTRLEAVAIKAIDTYREKLVGLSHLVELEKLAAEDLGAQLPLHGALDAALLELRQQLAA